MLVASWLANPPRGCTSYKILLLAPILLTPTIYLLLVSFEQMNKKTKNTGRM